MHGPRAPRRPPPAAPLPGFCADFRPSPGGPRPPAVAPAYRDAPAQRGGRPGARVELDSRGQRGKQNSTPFPTSGTAHQPRRPPSQGLALGGAPPALQGPAAGAGGSRPPAAPPRPWARRPERPCLASCGPSSSPLPVPFHTLPTWFPSPLSRTLSYPPPPPPTALGREGAPGRGADPFLPRLLEAVELGTQNL